MKGFIRFQASNDQPVILALSEIKQVNVDDRYHPDQGARIMCTDGSSIKTSWQENVETIQTKIAEATA